MTQNTSKSREQADAAFGKTQSQFLARSRIVEEHDAVSQARDEKTIRLREQRLAKEAADEAARAAAPMKRAGKR